MKAKQNKISNSNKRSQDNGMNLTQLKRIKTVLMLSGPNGPLMMMVRDQVLNKPERMFNEEMKIYSN